MAVFEIEITILFVIVFQKGFNGSFFKQGSVKNFR